MKANAKTSLQAYQNQLTKAKLTSHQNLIAQRERYISDKVLAYFFEDFNGMVYESKANDGRFLVMAFKNKAAKPAFYYSFKTQEQKERHIAKWAADEIKKIKHKQERKAEQKKLQENALELVNIGDVFRSSWGYEQTNVDYYQVIAVKGKSTVTLREIAADVVYNGNDTGTKKPIKDSFIGDEFDKRITVHGFKDGKANVTISLSSFQSASLKHPLADGSYSSDYYSSYY